MASTIRIKRSGVSGNPSTLAQGELAYSYFNGAGGDRLYVGTGTETLGDAANHTVIGGKYYVDLLGGEGNAPFGTLTANTALIADSDSKLDIINIDNVTINGNSITTSTGNLTLNPTGSIDASSNKIVNLGTPTDGTDAATKAYVDAITGGESIQLDIVGDTGSDTISLADSALDIAGGTGIATAVTDNTVTINLSNTGVSASTYGSATSVPVITVNAQGQITSATTASVASTLTFNGEAISLLDSSLTIAEGEGIDVAFTSATNTLTISGEDATTTNKGIASFATADFGVSSGAVSLNDAVVKSITTDASAATPSNHTFKIDGDSAQGLSTSGSGSTVTITAANATTSSKGVASFASADFSVSSGAVSIKTGGVSNTQLENASVTINAGTALTGGGAVALGSSIALNVAVDSSTIDFSADKLIVKDGGITNAKLANSSITIGTDAVSLGNTITDLNGLTSVDVDNITIDGNTISTTSGDLILDPTPAGGAGNVYIQGNLFVEGTTTTINSTELSINDKNIVLADSASSAAEADGGGITLNGANATITYTQSGDKWNTNKPLDVAGQLFIDGVAFEQLVDSEVANLLLEGEGIDLTYNDSAGTLTIAGEDATTTNKGIASFDSANFSVTSGNVVISAVDGGTY